MASIEEVNSCLRGNLLMLANGKAVKYESAGFSKMGDSDSVQPVTKGMVGKHMVDTLRDTGCSGVIVRRELVDDRQLTGDTACF